MSFDYFMHCSCMQTLLINCCYNFKATSNLKLKFKVISKGHELTWKINSQNFVVVFLLGIFLFNHRFLIDWICCKVNVYVFLYFQHICFIWLAFVCLYLLFLRISLSYKHNHHTLVTLAFSVPNLDDVFSKPLYLVPHIV